MNNENLNKAYLEVLRNDVNGFEKRPKNRLEELIEKYNALETSTKQDVIDLLNIALMDEFLAEFNYYASYNLSKTDGKADYDPEFQQHEDEEREHRKDITNRLRELGADVPKIMLQDFLILNSAGKDWKQANTNISNDLLLHRYNEELGAIKFYGLIFSVLKKLPLEERDTTTEMLIKKIKADEEEHAKDLKDLLIEHKILTTSLTQSNVDNDNIKGEIQ